MLWTKKGDKKSGVQPIDPIPPVASDPALDATGAILRILGKYAFDLDQIGAKAISEQYEQWARHILIAAPYPGAEGNNADRSGQADRNWQGLRDFVTQIRRSENAYVTSNFKNIRQVLGNFIDTLGKAIAEDDDDQEQIADRLSYLKNVIESNASLDAIKREAMQVIGAVGHIVEVRQQTHRSLLENLTGRIRIMREELSAARQEMELDPLTQLFNRKAFDQQLLNTFELHRLSAQPACLLMADLDLFKSINDRFGHPVGDSMLKKFADCCVQTFPRRSDFVARYGGEEFAIILQETTMESAKTLAERLQQAIRGLRVPCEDQTLSITASIGIAELSTQDDVPGWLRRADQLMYRAKREGRDRIAA
ncbi:MAG: GGDEF domain-containing protein [Candidatus Contendobacter sp.]|jgi:diguanylate cyclase|nr:GGDEF domain-containing protein [Gammaproteobacteria bacterium]MCC8994128.1 GGDEF domain-containing protein [Candidatus Contendobacter sp.]